MIMSFDPGVRDMAITSDVNTGLVDAEACLQAVFPVEATRPSLRWFRRLGAHRKIPSVRVGRRVFFNVEKVRAALEEKFTIEAL